MSEPRKDPVKPRFPLPSMFHRPGGEYANLSTPYVAGLALADARRALGMTQTALAEAADVAHGTVSRAERTGRVSLAHFVALVNALELRIGLQRPPAADEFDEVFNRASSEPPVALEK